MSLVEDGVLELATTARSLLGDDLPLIGDDVTVEHLLGHRSGIGDYLDEEDSDLDLSDYVLSVPAHELATTEDYLAVLGGYPTKFAPDERFAYCNGGYVVLALIAERASAVPYHDLVTERVCRPAGMRDTAFLRSDELAGAVASGYVEMDGVWRTNIFHLPVRGTGDGGVYSTVADIRSLWTAFFRGEVVSPEWVREMTRRRSDAEHGMGYGLGFWLDASSEVVQLEGMDAGVSFRGPAGMRNTAFLRSDELSGPVALGYVEMGGTWRTNVFHLPVRGTGDGGGLFDRRRHPLAVDRVLPR